MSGDTPTPVAHEVVLPARQALVLASLRRLGPSPRQVVWADLGEMKGQYAAICAGCPWNSLGTDLARLRDQGRATLDYRTWGAS